MNKWNLCEADEWGNAAELLNYSKLEVIVREKQLSNDAGTRVPRHDTIVSCKVLSFNGLFHIKVTVGLFGLHNRNDPLDSQHKNANKEAEASEERSIYKEHINIH